MDIYLVRHGEAAARWGEASDPGLSELGVAQAQQAAAYLAPRLSAKAQLRSSPLARARQTAQPLADTLAAQLVIEPAFREIPSPVPLEQRQDWLRQFMREHWDTQEAVLQDWRDAAFDTLLALQAPTAVFTHFLVINAIVGRLQGRAQTLCFWPDNGSITQLRRTGQGLELVALGEEVRTRVN
ncbi:MAG: phosphoglycerate mutase [Halioglobus sp.]|nr:phosphoglycerate mutase [Halioglobus sp.]